MNLISALATNTVQAARTAALTRGGEPIRTAAEEAAADGIPDAGAKAGMASKQTFLTLLVAQIKNQNPLNPADGTEFLSQLAQFSELEQLISIREELESINTPNAEPTPGESAAS